MRFLNNTIYKELLVIADKLEGVEPVIHNTFVTVYQRGSFTIKLKTVSKDSVLKVAKKYKANKKIGNTVKLRYSHVKEPVARILKRYIDDPDIGQFKMLLGNS